MKIKRSLSKALLSLSLLLSATFIGAMEDAHKVKTSAWLNSIKNLPTMAKDAVTHAAQKATHYAHNAQQFAQAHPYASLAAGSAVLVAAAAYGACKYATPRSTPQPTKTAAQENIPTQSVEPNEEIKALDLLLRDIARCLNQYRKILNYAFANPEKVKPDYQEWGKDLLVLLNKLPANQKGRELQDALQEFYNTMKPLASIINALKEKRNSKKITKRRKAIDQSFEKAANLINSADATAILALEMVQANAAKEVPIAVVVPAVVAKQGLFARAGQALKNGWNSSCAATKSVASKVAHLVPSKSTAVKAAGLMGAAAATGCVGYNLYQNGAFGAMKDAVVPAVKKILSKE